MHSIRSFAPTALIAVLLAAAGTGAARRNSRNAASPTTATSVRSSRRTALPATGPTSASARRVWRSTRRRWRRSRSSPARSRWCAASPRPPSELIRRVLETDVDERMPPAETGKHLTAAQIATLRRGIAEGAQWQTHWSHLEPRAVEPSRDVDDLWSQNPIDRFVIERLLREGMQPLAEADRVTLIRRLSFDLIGLPPDTCRGRLTRSSPTPAPPLTSRSSIDSSRHRIRRAHGRVLARSRALRRHDGLPQRQHAQRDAVPRLGDPGVPREPPLRPLHDRAARGRSAAGADAEPRSHRATTA